MAQSSQEPEVYQCFWHYKENAGFEGGRAIWRVAICEPKSADNTIETKEILKFCKVCPVFIKNKALTEATARKIIKESKFIEPLQQTRVIEPKRIAQLPSLTADQAELLMAHFDYRESDLSFECPCGNSLKSHNSCIEHIHSDHPDLWKEVISA